MPDEITPEDAAHAVRNARLSSSLNDLPKHVSFDDALWHPLDHRIGSRRCRSFRTDHAPEPRVKGLRWDNQRPILYHWNNWWLYKADSDLAWLYKLFRCRWGKHKPQTWHRSNGGSSFTVCAWCGCDCEPTDSQV